MARNTRADDLSRSLTAFDQPTTLIIVIEMSRSGWLVAGLVPGVERQPKKKLDPDALVGLVQRWREEAIAAGRTIARIALAFEAGRDGFWLARWLHARGIEAHVIHSTSVAVPREKRRAKTDRLDAAMLIRVFLGWLRGSRACTQALPPGAMLRREASAATARWWRCQHSSRRTLAGLAVSVRRSLPNARGSSTGSRRRWPGSAFKPQLRAAAAKLDDLRTPEGVTIPPNTRAELRRDMARLAMLRAQIAEIEAARIERLETAPARGPHPMIKLLARVVGVGLETADMLVTEVLSRDLRDRRAVARYAGVTGSPDESGAKRREKGLSRAGNARVRRGMIQLAWRWLLFQKESALTLWFKERTAGAPALRKKMIVALARKLLIALWQFATAGMIPEGIVLRPAP